MVSLVAAALELDVGLLDVLGVTGVPIVESSR